MKDVVDRDMLKEGFTALIKLFAERKLSTGESMLCCLLFLHSTLDKGREEATDPESIKIYEEEIEQIVALSGKIAIALQEGK